MSHSSQPRIKLDERSIPLTSPAGFAYTVSKGAWQRAVHLDYLNRKIVEAATGRLKYLIVSMPPRHGKSMLISRYTPPWYLGLFPNNRVILIGYSEDFAGKWGFAARKLVEDHGYQHFGIKVDPDRSAQVRWELKGFEGGMDSIGIGGGVVGKGANLFIIDDPIKKAEEARSPTFRDNMWDWWESEAHSRLEPNGSVILVMTRWHQDDFAARLIKLLQSGLLKNSKYEIINFPAIAMEHDILGRKPGEALWPWRYSIEDLEEIKNIKTEYWWTAQYQGQPIPPGGNMFKRDWFEIMDTRPSASQVVGRVRFWDVAATHGGDYTVGTLMSRTSKDDFFVEDVIREKVEANALEKLFVQTLALDGEETMVRMEQEGGSSGKITIALYARLALGYDFEGVPSLDSKETRWEPFASQSQVGNVKLVKGHWNSRWLDEMQHVPSSKHDDQADSASGGFACLVKSTRSQNIVVI